MRQAKEMSARLLCAAHSIPWPVACSWKDGDPYCSIQTYCCYYYCIAEKRQWGGEKEKARRESLTAGRPPCSSKLSRWVRRCACFCFPFALQSGSGGRRRAHTTVCRARHQRTKRTRASKGSGGKDEQESLPFHQRVCCLLAASSCPPAVRLLLLSFPILLHFLFRC